MSGISLSITIPSYNRHDQLCARIAELIPQLEAGVEVWVLDNASTPDLEQYVCDRVEGARSAIRFVRNPSNIGACANVCRCFEVARGDWVWLLGDDDSLLPGALRSVLEVSAGASPSDVLLKFNSTNGGQVDHEEILDGIPALSTRCRNPLFYSNLLFISSSVYRRQTMVSRLSIGYHWCFSSAPHIAMLLDAIGAGGRMRLLPRELVRHGQAGAADNWNVTRVSAGFISLGDMESGGDFPANAMPAIALHYLGGRRWWRQLVKGFLSDTGRSPAFWCGYFVRFGSTIGGPRGLLITILAWGMRLLVKVPGVKTLGCRLLQPSDTLGNLDRS
jgi:glycosyltransferase involved in cell wall biosynthesis